MNSDHYFDSGLNVDVDNPDRLSIAFEANAAATAQRIFVDDMKKYNRVLVHGFSFAYWSAMIVVVDLIFDRNDQTSDFHFSVDFVENDPMRYGLFADHHVGFADVGFP